MGEHIDFASSIDFKTTTAWQGHRDGEVLITRTYSYSLPGSGRSILSRTDGVWFRHYEKTN